MHQPYIPTQVLLFDWDFSSTAAAAAAAAEEEDGEHSCYTFSRFADELVELMDKMELRGAVYVGHSMAGMVGCIASIKRPDLFTHLVLVGASPR
jgi:pimeloyl-ACP methyl ester carboxylesterase